MKFTDKIKLAIQQMMQGRYGFDHLGRFISTTCIILAFIALFVHNWLVTLFVTSLLVLFYYRFLSRDFAKRQAENNLYLKYYNRLKSMRDYKYFKCSNCQQILRVPRKRGKILVTCPKCKQEMHKKS